MNCWESSFALAAPKLPSSIPRASNFPSLHAATLVHHRRNCMVIRGTGGLRSGRPSRGRHQGLSLRGSRVHGSTRISSDTLSPHFTTAPTCAQELGAWLLAVGTLDLGSALYSFRHGMNCWEFSSALAAPKLPRVSNFPSFHAAYHSGALHSQLMAS